MVKHLVIWKLQDKCFGPNLETIKENMKTSFESLEGKIPGLVSINVNTHCLSSSNGDVSVEAVFESEDALKEYQKHELRLEATKDTIFPFVETTTHVEYEI